jgi:hypothetical protein
MYAFHKEKKRLGLFSALGNTEMKTKLVDLSITA